MPKPIRHTRFVVPVAAICSIVSLANAQNYSISTVAGGGPKVGTQATNMPLGMVQGVNGIAIDSHGTVFVASDPEGRVYGFSSNGTLTQIIGVGNPTSWAYSGDNGPASLATVDYPCGVTVDSRDNLYIAMETHVARVDSATGIITSIAGDGPENYLGDGGPAVAASMYVSCRVAVDSKGNVFIADRNNNRIRKVDASSGIITTVAGNGLGGFGGDGGPATAASLNGPQGLALDAAGNIFVADRDNARIRKVDSSTGIISTVAGSGATEYGGDGGQALAAGFVPASIAFDSQGNLLIVDDQNNRVRRVAVGTGIITTVAGDGYRNNYSGRYNGDGIAATQASLNAPEDVAVDPSGNLYILDKFNFRVRKVAAGSGLIATVAGNGSTTFGGDGGAATSARLMGPVGVALDSTGNLFIADRGNYRIRKVTSSTGVIATVAGTGASDEPRGDGGPAANATLGWIEAITVDRAGNVFVADSISSFLRKIAAGTGIITSTNVSTGSSPSLATDSAGNLFVGDWNQKRIRKVAAGTGAITYIAGNGSSVFSGDNGPATAAGMTPQDIAVDGSGNLYIADYFNKRVRKVAAATGVITTVAGNGTSGIGGDGGSATTASLGTPVSVTVDPAGNLFIAVEDPTSPPNSFGVGTRIRRVSTTTGIITTIAGDGSYNYGADGSAAAFTGVFGVVKIAADQSSNVYIAAHLSGGILDPYSLIQVLKPVDSRQALVTVTSDPPGLRLTVDGNHVVTPRSAYWDPGSAHTIGAADQTGAVGAQYQFLSWSQGGAASQSLTAPAAVASYTARFRTQYKLSTYAGTGGGILPAAGWYDAGGSASISASANSGYTFIGFSGALSGLATPRTLTMDAPKTVFASFLPTPPDAGPPSATSAVNGGSYSPEITDGAWMSIMGSNLSLTSRSWRNDEIVEGVLPVTLDGVSLTVGGLPAAISYVSPGQINAQAPATGKTGLLDVVVTTPLGRSTVSANVKRNAPGLLTFTARYPAALIARADGNVDYLGPVALFGTALATRPAKPGETILLYATGLGPTNPAVPPGQVFSGAAATVDPVSVTIGGAKASVAYAGLVGAGLYQVNVAVPNVALGDQALALTINGATAQAGTFVAVGQ